MNNSLERKNDSNHFSLAENFLIPTQISLKKPDGTETIEQTNSFDLKVSKVIEKLSEQQVLSEGFYKDLQKYNEKVKDNAETNKERERILNGKWKRNDVISVRGMKNTEGIINDSELIQFKVLIENENKFTVIFKCLNSEEYKIRDINPTDCGTFNFTTQKNIFPTNKEILESQTLINDYLISRDKRIKEQVELLSQKIKEISATGLKFIKINDQNSFYDWEWEINLQKIKEKILNGIKNTKTLKQKITKGDLTFTFSETSKENIKNSDKTTDAKKVTFEIIYNTEFSDLKYKTTTPEITFNLNKDSTIAKERLKTINIEISEIKSSVESVNEKITEITKNLNTLHNQIIKSLESKKQEWENLSEHTNLKVQSINHTKIKTIQKNIKALNSNLLNIEKQLSELKILNQNQDFYKDYSIFFKY